MCNYTVFGSKGRGAATGQKNQGFAVPAKEPLRDEIVDKGESLFMRQIDAGHFGKTSFLVIPSFPINPSSTA